MDIAGQFAGLLQAPTDSAPDAFLQLRQQRERIVAFDLLQGGRAFPVDA